MFATPENIDAIANKIINRQNNTQESPIISLLKAQKTELQKSISNVMSAIEQGIITSTTKCRLTELEAQLEKISASIIKEEMNKPRVLTKTEITTFIASALKKQPKGACMKHKNNTLYCSRRSYHVVVALTTVITT